MNSLSTIYLMAIAAAVGVAHAQAPQAPAPAAAVPATRIAERYSEFAGSTSNARSLVTGLRSGTEIELRGDHEVVVLRPPTRPMGYGNITRSLDLASRQLAAVGITDPTPQQVSAPLMGGTVHTANGDVTLSGVLKLRSDGMGWGQVAHAIGVQPGMGQAKAMSPAVPASSTGASAIRTAGGGAVVRPSVRADAPSGGSRSITHVPAAGQNAAPGLVRAQEMGHAQGRALGRN